MINGDQETAELIAINLLFAKAELSAKPAHDGAIPRALDHIFETLELLRKDIISNTGTTEPDDISGE